MKNSARMSDSGGGNNDIRTRVKRGHAKKRRLYTKPITSYGVLLYSFKDDTPVFLLYQRRDTFEYMDFMRGCWSSEGQLITLFSLMSHEERVRLREYTFRELWDDLWVVHNCRIYRDGFGKAKKKYESVKHRIAHILDSTTSRIYEPPWGWPKGKKDGYNEDHVTCALRELKEETRIDITGITVVNRTPYVENFKGSNGKTYATYYYLCELPRPVEATRIDTPQCIRKTTISEEAEDVRWFTFDEACNRLNPRRQTILKEVMDIITGKK